MSTFFINRDDGIAIDVENISDIFYTNDDKRFPFDIYTLDGRNYQTTIKIGSDLIDFIKNQSITKSKVSLINKIKHIVKEK